MTPEESKLLAIVHRMLCNPDGQYFMDHLDRMFGTDAPSFVRNADGNFDVTHAAIRDGQKQVPCHIRSLIKRAYANKEQKPKPRKAKTE